MSPLFAYLTAGFGFAWTALHFFAGGHSIAKPLRAHEGLPHTVMATMWMCWHMVTAAILLLGILPLIALWFDLPGMIIATALLAGGIALAGILAAPALGTSYKIIPQDWLFIPNAVLALLAL